MNCIVLTAQQAASIRGATKGAMLDPVALNDGSFVLPARVLDDPAHAAKLSALTGKPQRNVAANEFASYAAPEPEPKLDIKITPDMLEAGSSVAGAEKLPPDTIIEIYRAMKALDGK